MTNTEESREETRLTTVIWVLMEGPAVSLKGSPTVSPMTAALWAVSYTHLDVYKRHPWTRPLSGLLPPGAAAETPERPLPLGKSAGWKKC